MNPLFQSSVYQNRRNKLKASLSSGIVLLSGNGEAAMNYRSNTYRYRQDSTFVYFFGLWQAGLYAVIDLDENREIIFGDDFDIEDIIWMGAQPSIRTLAEGVGVTETLPLADLNTYISEGLQQGRDIHFLPPYRGHDKITLSKLTGIAPDTLSSRASVPLIKAVVGCREVKEDIEIAEMREACRVGVKMHETVRQHVQPGVSERYLAGLAEGVALSEGNGVSFPVILSQHGETLHNHSHEGILQEGQMLLMDAGAEGLMGYASDYTRVFPVSGHFTLQQREIYDIVLAAQLEGIRKIQPGVYYKEVHRAAAEVIVNGLKELGLMKGNTKEAVECGAHALFFPHGLGHMLGLDVHDMENLGEDFVGYDHTIQRSHIFGWNALRVARELKQGFVITVEPGIYFIPQLIDLWKSNHKFENFICYNRLEDYHHFGGIRIEDDVLVTSTGSEVLGPPLPKTIGELEK
jgi:Xaa-Pro aminopeptidase